MNTIDKIERSGFNDLISRRITTMKDIDVNLYKLVTSRLGILPITLEAIDRIEAEFGKELIGERRK